MSTKNTEQEFLLLAEGLFEDLLAMSDAEILAEAAEDFGSVEAVANSIREEIKAAINAAGKDQLVDARAAAARNRDQAPRTKVDYEQAKNLLDLFLSSDAGRSRITMAARKGKSSSKSDVLSAFSDLCYLQGCKRHSSKLDFGNSPKAEKILTTLGVTDPCEIDVEAIAWHLGAEVRYDDLKDCEARIIGTDDIAIITVNKNVSPQRQRFSICHELGHWILHRRRMLVCQDNEIERPGLGAASMERAADRFAAELLMPSYLFVPIAQSLGKPSMHVVQKLSEVFNTSYTAAAIRLVEVNRLPVLLTCHGVQGRNWFTKSQTVDDEWRPQHELSPDSAAFSMIFGQAPSAMPPRSVSASKWFGRLDASQYEVVEESIRVSRNEVLTLIAFKDAPRFLRS